MRRLSIAVVVLALGAVVVLNIGCGDAGEKLAERATEKAVEKISGEKVKVAASGSADASALPAFLRYPGAKVIDEIAMSGSEGKGTVWHLETGDGPTKVGDWYRVQLVGKGWTKIDEMEAGESVMLNYHSAAATEHVGMLAHVEGGKTTISLTYATK